MSGRLGVMCVALIFSATGAAAGADARPLDPSADVEVRMTAASTAPLRGEVLQVETDPGRSIEIFLRVQNLSTDHVEDVEVSIEQRDRRGRVRAFHAFTHPAHLDPGRELFLSRMTADLEPRPGDVFQVSLSPTRNPGAAERGGEGVGTIEKQYPFKGCSGFCDRRADRADSLCSSGLSEYSCSCTESSSSRSFKCAV